jgi:hypothetical protein
MLVTIEEIREALTLYFIRQLAEDENRRARRPPREKKDFPQWSTHEKWEDDPDNHISDYHELLQDELKFNFTRNAGFFIQVLEEYEITKLDTSSDQFKWAYREFIRTEIEAVKVILKRIQCDYSDEMRYLWADDTGLSSPAVSLCDLSQPRSSMFHDHIRQRALQQKQQKHSHEGVAIRKRETEETYADFDLCVVEKTSQYPDKDASSIARSCKRQTGIDRSEQALRKRVRKVLDDDGSK